MSSENLQQNNHSQTILIVEDNDDDFEAAESALRAAENFANPLIRCETGRDALDLLMSTGAYAPPHQQPSPGLVLLDLNLPGMDGHEVLSQIKADPRLRSIPVIVMTSSTDPRDIEACYQAGANSYVHKPLEWDGFFTAVARLKEYWLEIALLPKV